MNHGDYVHEADFYPIKARTEKGVIEENLMAWESICIFFFSFRILNASW